MWFFQHKMVYTSWFYHSVFSTFGEVNWFLFYTSSMLRFITFLKTCGELHEPLHPHLPNRKFWEYPFNAAWVLENVWNFLLKNSLCTLENVLPTIVCPAVWVTTGVGQNQYYKNSGLYFEIQSDDRYSFQCLAPKHHSNIRCGIKCH